MKLPLTLLAALSTAPVAQAQIEFDIIVSRSVTMPQAGVASSDGILINTGTEPITKAQWLSGFHATYTDVPTNGIGLEPSDYNWDVLMPGEAVGRAAGQNLEALLGPDVTLIDDLGVFNVRIFQDPAEPIFPEFATATTVVEVLGRRVEVSQEYTFSGSVSWADPFRSSSFIVGPGVIETTPGCPLPGGQELGLVLKNPQGEFADGPTLFAPNSSLPALGNTELDLFLDTPALPSLAGSPYVLSVRLDTGLVDLGGCTVAALDGPVILQPIGLLQATGGPFGATSLKNVVYELPIPEDPALLGVEVQAQWAILTTTATNGLFATSRSLKLTITSV